MGFINGPKNIITNGLVFYQDAANKQTYPGSGTNSYDISSQNNNGTFVNNTGFSTDNGGAFVFDGTDDRITCGINGLRPDESTLNANGFTIIANVKTDDSSLAFQGIFGTDGVNQSTYYGLEAAFAGSSNKRWVLAKYDGTGAGSGDRRTATCPASINDDQWYHVAFNFVNSSVSSFLIYVDGVVQTMTTSGTGGSVGYSGTSLSAIGAVRTFDWDGSIARVLCYNRTLSAAEILQDYNTVKSRFE